MLHWCLCLQAIGWRRHRAMSTLQREQLLVTLLLLLLALADCATAVANHQPPTDTLNTQHISPSTSFPDLGHQLRWVAAITTNETQAECELATQLQYHLVLHDLEPNAGYELRLSYLGTLPYRFNLAFDTPVTTSANSHHRMLLDTEKLIFHTDDSGHVTGRGVNVGTSPTVVLTANLYSYTLPSTACIYKQFTTTIQLEHLYLKAIQPIVLRVVPLLIVGVVIMLWFVRPVLKSSMLSSFDADDAKRR